MISRRLVPMLVALLPGVSLASDVPSPGPRKVDFDRDIRPVLAEHCFPCHGPDARKRKADFRLDTKQGAFAARDGGPAIVPGKPEESELVLRVASDDADEMMPPPVDRQRKSFSAEDADLIRRWVAEGAEYRGHWAFEKPARPEIPPGVGDPIDRFVAAKLIEQGLKPAPSADRVTLIRRLSFDLTGLPPTPGEVESFVRDTSPDAYERLVDRLLASPHYGERMAVAWLDQVRFADTAGYHSDNHRDVWLYRDFVIDAFNKNTPFNRFTVEQLAGDLLPGATREQRIASGYNRMLQTTEEGGAQAKEYVAKYAADRVRNASTVWLGITLGCAECHDHKFDPFTTRDFYRFAAFFADVQEVPVGRQPATKMPTPEQEAKIAALDAKVAPLNKILETTTPELAAAQSAWEKGAREAIGRWSALVPTSAKSESGAKLKIEPDGTVVASGKASDSEVYTLTFQVDRQLITALRLDVLPDPKLPRGGPGRAGNGNFVLNEFVATVAGQPVALANPSASHSQPSWDVSGAIDGDPRSGWAILDRVGRSTHAVFETKADLGDATRFPLTIRLVQQHGDGHAIGKFRISASEQKRPVKAGGDEVPPTVRDALAIEPDKRSKEQGEALAAHYRSIAPALEPARQQIASLNRERDAILASETETLIATSGPPRTMRVLPRGNWLDDSGAVVTPAVPESLGQEVKGRRATRLDLANWLVGDDNPLVARVFVNRLWKIAFGQGLVTSIEDFGSQGSSPTHPELLDWLAVEFRESGWDVKRLMKRIVMTRAYQQASTAPSALLQSDPYNRWLARQGRFRLDAEFVRDDMLVVSGLFAPKVGGPSVKPYQPEGYWAHLNFPRREYHNDHGESLYRRAMYTYWQRSFLHPSLLAFDAPSREECTANRPRSNTPLQALVLLNDPIFVEGARAFAEKVIHEGGRDDAARLDFAYRRSLSRTPREDERAVLLELLAKHRDHYRAHTKEAEELLHVGERPPSKDIEPTELAAWTSVARAILNLHETITRN